MTTLEQATCDGGPVMATPGLSIPGLSIHESPTPASSGPDRSPPGRATRPAAADSAPVRSESATPVSPTPEFLTPDPVEHDPAPAVIIVVAGWRAGCLLAAAMIIVVTEQYSPVVRFAAAALLLTLPLVLPAVAVLGHRVARLWVVVDLVALSVVAVALSAQSAVSVLLVVAGLTTAVGFLTGRLPRRLAGLWCAVVATAGWWPSATLIAGDQRAGWTVVIPVCAVLFGYGLVRGGARVARDLSKRPAEMAQQFQRARRQDVTRHQLALHDAASILAFVARGTLDSRLEPLLRRQAAAEADRIRAFLQQDAESLVDSLDPVRGGSASLVRTALTAVSGFADLPLTTILDLAAEIRIAPATADAVERALTALLHNVRLHAAAGSVVLHADVLDEGGCTFWELTITDDGSGFDRSSTAFGFGLGTQVRDALRDVGLDFEIHSAAGEGTRTRIFGPVQRPATTR